MFSKVQKIGLVLMILISSFFMSPLLGAAKKKNYATGTKHAREGGGFVCECPTFYHGCACVVEEN